MPWDGDYLTKFDYRDDEEKARNSDFGEIMSYPLKDNQFEKAAELGLEVVIPDARTITADFDSPEPPDDIDEKLQLLEQFFKIGKRSYTTSKSGNQHLY